MSKNLNLSGEIEDQLPAELVAFIRRAGEVAASQGQSLYLVGGVVRDLLLRQTNLDLDLVVEGNALKLAQQLAETMQGQIITHPRFNTAKIQWHKWSIDLATARSETYAKPGALPSVKPSSISKDLFRRDFTINAMAINLTSGSYGELLDPYGGGDDIRHKLIRILHENSFTDDATRIWRGLRYEQRLNFKLESTTLQLLKRDIPRLDTISADRIRYEVECILREAFPEKVLRRAEELKVLTKLHPSLKGNGWLAEKFGQARQLSSPNPPSVGLYLSLFAYPLTGAENESLISRLRLPRAIAQTLRDTHSLKDKLPSLSNPQLAPSAVYRLLYGYTSTAIIANSFASDHPVASQHIHLFLNRLRYVRPALSGDDLKKMGVTAGRDIGLVLKQIHEAKLDGKIATKKEEEGLVNTWIAQNMKAS